MLLFLNVYAAGGQECGGHIETNVKLIPKQFHILKLFAAQFRR